MKIWIQIILWIIISVVIYILYWTGLLNLNSSIITFGILSLIYLIRLYIDLTIKHSFVEKTEKLRFSIKKFEEEGKFIRDMVRLHSESNDNIIKTIQIKSVEDLWNKFLEIKKFSTLVESLAHLNLKEFINKRDDPRIRKFFEFHVELIDLEKIKNISFSAEFSRLWVSPMAWASYLTYETIVNHVIGIFTILSIGEDPEVLLKKDKIEALLKNSIPNLNAKTLEYSIFPQYLEYLELNFLLELQNQILLKDPSTEAIEKTKKIVKLAAEVNSEIDKSKFKQDFELPNQ